MLKQGVILGPPKQSVFHTANQPSVSVPNPVVANMPEQKKYKEVNNNDMSSEEEITLKYIIKDKPSTKTVREFFRANLKSIRSENDILFD